MKFRLANNEDLFQLKIVYGKIIDNMNDNGIGIWDNIYPCEFFKEDIEKEQLYVLYNENELVAAFALCNSNIGENSVKWKNKQEKALYIDRFGVSVEHLRQGIGSVMLQNAVKVAREKGFKYLRLFVVDINEPAINLYKKNGFKQVGGVFDEVIDDELILHEYGFEKEI